MTRSLSMRCGLWTSLALVALAIGAPLLAGDRPFFVCIGPADAHEERVFGALPSGTTFPWATGLFDTNAFPSAVDLVCNGLLAIAPVVFVAWLALRRRAAMRRFVLVLALPLAAALAAACAHQEPHRDWKAGLARLEADGRGTTAVFPPVPYGPSRTDVLAALEPPGRDHLLGTDDAGRDVLARLLFGIRVSLAIGLVAVALTVGIGMALGALAGFFRGAVDAVVLRLIEVVSCFPAFLLVMALIALVRERSLFHVMLVIGVTGWPTIARLVRAEFLRLSATDFATAARALGLPWRRVVFRHLLPNGLAPVLVAAAFGMAGAILIESGLAFLRLGDGSVASWGQVLRVGRETGALHLILAPGLLIFLTVTMMNLVAQGLRDAMDPRRNA